MINFMMYVCSGIGLGFLAGTIIFAIVWLADIAYNHGVAAAILVFLLIIFALFMLIVSTYSLSR